MNQTVAALSGCSATRGVRQIVLFNWPLYMAAVCSALVLTAAASLPALAGLRVGLQAASGLACAWMVASLVVSWVVYDRSPLSGVAWIPETVGFAPRTWLVIHAGLDETTESLRVLLPESRGRAFDIYDSREMTEPSIERARRSTTVRDGETADFRQLSAPSVSVDVAIVPLSAHELRTHRTRCDLFRELARVLAPGGLVVVAEHLRDIPNFAAFGPGVLHFHSRDAWVRCFSECGLCIRRERSVTPFVRVFVLGRPQ